jgi:transcriptional regulator with XRE-family HTH domain
VSGGRHDRRVDDQRLGGVFRSVRIQRRWRQEDLADAAGVARSTVSRLERGHLGEISVSTVRRISAALDVRVELVARWRGGDLDRLIGAGHSALHEAIARLLVRTPGWVSAPEVSFSAYGERGVIDVLAWHAERRMLLVIELKTELIDVQSLIGQVDRYRRLADGIGRERGWEAAAVSCWVVLGDSRANRRRLARHATVLRGAFPIDGRSMAGWLRRPDRPIAALSFLPNDHPGNARRSFSTPKRVRLPRPKPD